MLACRWTARNLSTPAYSGVRVCVSLWGQACYCSGRGGLGAKCGDMIAWRAPEEVESRVVAVRGGVKPPYLFTILAAVHGLQAPRGGDALVLVVNISADRSPNVLPSGARIKDSRPLRCVPAFRPACLAVGWPVPAQLCLRCLVCALPKAPPLLNDPVSFIVFVFCFSAIATFPPRSLIVGLVASLFGVLSLP